MQNKHLSVKMFDRFLILRPNKTIKEERRPVDLYFPPFPCNYFGAC
jgi:hypothetical protein